MRIEALDCAPKDNCAAIRTKPTTWPPAEGTTHDGSSKSADVFGHESSAFDLEQREMKIIADLEHGEETARRITGYHGNKDDLNQFGSMSTESFSDVEEKRKVGARGCMLGCGRCRGEVVHQLGAVIYYPLAPLGQLRTSLMIYCHGPLLLRLHDPIAPTKLSAQYVHIMHDGNTLLPVTSNIPSSVLMY